MPAATKSSTSKRSSKRSSGKRSASGGRTKAKGRTAAKPKAKAKRRAGKQKRRTGEGALRRHLAPVVTEHAADLVGLFLVTVGIVAGLGVWADAAGPAGSGIDTGIRTVVGRLAVFVPVIMVIAGGLLLVGRGLPFVPRLLLGAALVVVAVVGLLHASGGRDGFSIPLEDVQAQGGWGGLIVGGPLRAALGPVGATVSLVALLLAGLLVAGGITVQRLAGVTGSFVRTAVRSIRGGGEGDAMPEDSSGLASAKRTDEDAVPADIPSPPPPAAVTPEAPVVPAVEPTGPAEEVAEPSGVVPPEASKGKRGRSKETSGEKTPPSGPEPSLVDEDFDLPPVDLLRAWNGRKVDRRELEERGRVIQDTLREFKVGATLVGIVAGPTVTRYEIELDQGVKVNQLTKLAPDICYALATPDVRILAPIPGRSAIGLEVPNRIRQLVTLGDVLRTPEAAEQHNPLDAALGRDISGKPVFVDLAEMPHLLIAGATGSGKSSCINSILTSLLCRTRPSEVRMILIDPKRVELGRYNRVPHLLTSVVTQPKRAAEALQWAVQEMDRRYDLLHEAGVRDIVGYNEGVDRETLPPHADGDERTRLPFIVVVVDELADLMLVAPKDVENSICRIAQMARAVGLHLVIATQRPSVNVITGVIKANVPSRMAFKVRTVTDSRVILDVGGAEKLVGQGDLLYLGARSHDTERIQSAFVSEAEVNQVVAHWRAQARAPDHDDTDEDVALVPTGHQTELDLDQPDVVFEGEHAVHIEADDEASDPYLEEACELVVRSQLGSTSMLQRKLRVGFARAGRIMDLLEQRGVVGPSEGSKARRVILAPEQLEEFKRNGMRLRPPEPIGETVGSSGSPESVPAGEVTGGEGDLVPVEDGTGPGPPAAEGV